MERSCKLNKVLALVLAVVFMLALLPAIKVNASGNVNPVTNVKCSGSGSFANNTRTATLTWSHKKNSYNGSIKFKIRIYDSRGVEYYTKTTTKKSYTFNVTREMSNLSPNYTVYADITAIDGKYKTTVPHIDITKYVNAQLNHK